MNKIEMWIIIMVMIIAAPISLPILLSAFVIVKSSNKRYINFYTMTVALSVLVMVVGLAICWIFDGAFSIWPVNPLIAGFMAILIAIFYYRFGISPSEKLLRENERKESKKMKLSEIKYVPPGHQLVVGVTGAGKTVFDSRTAEEIIARDPDAFLLCVDGKGATNSHSLYDNLMIISQKYNRTLRIINCTASDDIDGCVYDPLSGISNASVATDLILSFMLDPTVELSSGAEFYKKATYSYLLICISFLCQHDIPITLRNVVHILSPDNWNSLRDRYDFSDSEYERFKSKALDKYEDAKANVLDFTTLMTEGEGAHFFFGDGEKINIYKAYQSRDILLVLADGNSMPHLAEKIVRLISIELRNFVGNRGVGKVDQDGWTYVILDEFCTYPSSAPYIAKLYGQSRSASCRITISTQSVSDIIAISRDQLNIFIDNSDRFVFFRQNSKDAIEEVVATLGTESHVTSTSRSSHLLMTGESSNTLDEAFIIPPRLIRSLERNHAFLYDKTAEPKDAIKYFRNKFVSADETIVLNNDRGGFLDTFIGFIKSVCLRFYARYLYRG